MEPSQCKRFVHGEENMMFMSQIAENRQLATHKGEEVEDLSVY
jgi:hypothetical protein